MPNTDRVSEGKNEPRVAVHGLDVLDQDAFLVIHCGYVSDGESNKVFVNVKPGGLACSRDFAGEASIVTACVRHWTSSCVEKKGNTTSSSKNKIYKINNENESSSVTSDEQAERRALKRRRNKKQKATRKREKTQKEKKAAEHPEPPRSRVSEFGSAFVLDLVSMVVRE